MRVLFWVQHLLGIGHARRASLIAEALAAAGAEVAVAQGGHPVASARFRGAEVVQLPPLRSADAAFSALVDGEGRPAGEALWAERTARLAALARRVRPEIVLLETFPFGRRAFRVELAPLLEGLAAAPDRPLVAASLRDILVRHDAKKDAWILRHAQRWCDLVLVHGDPRLLPLEASFPPAAELAERIRYTGYVVPLRTADAAPGADGTDEVVVSVGGGAVGAGVLQAAVAARPLSRQAGAARWRLLLGPDLPEPDRTALMAAAHPGLLVEPARPDFPDLLTRCRLSVSQAGYNTVMDVVGAGCRAVLVPFARGQETEQTDRAALLAARGHVHVTAEAGLTPERLAAAVDAALAGPPPPPLDLATDGAAATARILLEAAGRRRGVSDTPASGL
ncbi:MAG: glycosyl transferase [Rhodospirillaceae bacterium]|nr:glycosyl transferase [Rhodospirillaceae bacterium]